MTNILIKGKNINELELEPCGFGSCTRQKVKGERYCVKCEDLLHESREVELEEREVYQDE